MEGKVGPFRLSPWFSARVWGRRDLRPWYSETGTEAPVGEAWLTGPDSIAETGPFAGQRLREIVEAHPDTVLGPGPQAAAEFPLLIKMLFPAEKLSVQVHPDDAQAQAMGQPRGKTECWYVLEAAAGAAVALGLKPDTSVADVRTAVAAGTLEDRLLWVPVQTGEMIFVDAGTVHAIGPGMVLLETQQTSDITFRLYDYGRPRELHLEDGLRVMRSKTGAGKVGSLRMDGYTRLIAERYFTVDRYDLAAGQQARVMPDAPGCLAGLGGRAWVRAEGFEPVELRAGQAVVLPVGAGLVAVDTADGAGFVRCFAPAHAAS